MSYSVQSHGLQHARLPGPSLSPAVCSNSCPLSRWCHPTILSSVVPFSLQLPWGSRVNEHPADSGHSSGNAPSSQPTTSLLSWLCLLSAHPVMIPTVQEPRSNASYDTFSWQLGGEMLSACLFNTQAALLQAPALMMTGPIVNHVSLQLLLLDPMWIFSNYF